jgi:hypothetical protein
VQVVEVADGSVRSVGPSPAFDAEPSWSRDGSTIAFVSERDGEPTVYAVARDGSNVRRWIEGHDPVFDWKVDALAYVRKDRVWVEAGAIAPMDVVSRPDILGPVDWRPLDPPKEAPLPDFAFSAGGRCHRYGIYLYSPDGERRLTNPCEFHGNGVVRGTPFRDFLYGGRGADRLLGGGRADMLDAGAGNDLLDGDGGYDTLLGRGGDDVLIGRGDPDTIVDGPGRDRIFAGAESDTILAKDGWRDSIDCGGGRDTVTADRFEHVAANCERVRR